MEVFRGRLDTTRKITLSLGGPVALSLRKPDLSTHHTEPSLEQLRVPNQNARVLIYNENNWGGGQRSSEIA